MDESKSSVLWPDEMRRKREGWGRLFWAGTDCLYRALWLVHKWKRFILLFEHEFSLGILPKGWLSSKTKNMTSESFAGCESSITTMQPLTCELHFHPWTLTFPHSLFGQLTQASMTHFRWMELARFLNLNIYVYKSKLSWKVCRMMFLQQDFAKKFQKVINSLIEWQLRKYSQAPYQNNF